MPSVYTTLTKCLDLVELQHVSVYHLWYTDKYCASLNQDITAVARNNDVVRAAGIFGGCQVFNYTVDFYMASAYSPVYSARSV